MRQLIFYLIVALITLFIAAPLFMLVKEGFLQLPTALKSREVQFAIQLSLMTSIISTLICLLLAGPVAYFLSRSSLRHFLMPILYLPLALPHIVSGVALLLFFGFMGIGTWLDEWFNLSFIFTKEGIILAQVFVNLPFAIRLIVLGLANLNEKQLFVARTLGASRWQCFRYVTLPLLKPTLLSVIVLTWSRALGEFGAVMMVAGSTRLKTEILPTSIMLNISTGDLDLALAIALILMIISLLCSTIFEYLLKSKYVHHWSSTTNTLRICPSRYLADA